MLWLNILVIIIGYLLGSVSPAYILGRLLRGIDIREHGTRNAGGRNVKKVLGLWPAVVTIIYDLSKGLLAMFIAWKLGAPEIFIYASGYAAILGHIFPFCLGFRGGEGQATTLGIFFFIIFKAILNHWFPYEILIPVVILALFLFIISPAEIVGAFALPTFIVLFLAKTQLNPTTVFMGILLVQMWIVTLYNVKKFEIFKNAPQVMKEIRFWRTFLRPLAIVLPILYLYFDKRFILIFVGSIALAFLLLDITRLLSRKTNLFLFKTPIIFKQKEMQTFSSISLFLVAIFLSFLVFPKGIGILAATFLIFGDVFAKIIGMMFGKVHILKKTLEGSISYFLAAVIFGLVFLPYIEANLGMLLVGALAATVVELIPWGVDDNISVALISGAVMYVMTIF
jgi:glycerol-3-phosphate acyltransferase PlsY